MRRTSLRFFIFRYFSKERTIYEIVLPGGYPRRSHC